MKFSPVEKRIASRAVKSREVEIAFFSVSGRET